MAVDDDMCSDGMQCTDHPYRTTSPSGGICAFCLQDKLDHSTTTSRPRIPFLLTQKKKKKALGLVPPSDDVQSSSFSANNSVLKRSKSSATPRSARFLEDFSPRRRGFWSFLHISNTHHKKPTTIVTPSATTTAPPENTTEAATSAAVVVMDETDESPNSSGGASNTASFGRKVSRSRSVGCGSRSFSGDFFERISTGFGDCTLRRVESHREGSKHRHSTSRAAGDTVREKVRCGGLFGGLIVTSSSSSTTSSSSSY
uniref:Uncharacterized protein n=1 Tax=Chenopodium quinoa TaxID=63459 RepID=A0A803LPQ1_CHEQI